MKEFSLKLHMFVLNMKMVPQLLLAMITKVLCVTAASIRSTLAVTFCVY